MHSRFLHETLARPPTRRAVRGPPRSVGAESAPVPQVQVKEIQVKQVDRSIAQIRASKEMSAGGGMSAAPAPAMTAATAEQIPTHGSQAASSAPAPAAAAGPSAMSVLNGAVARVISPAPASWDERREPIQNFVSALCDGDASADLPEGAQLDVLAEVAAQAPALAEACAGSPKQFWATAEVLTALVVDLPDGTAVFDAAVAAFGALDPGIRADIHVLMKRLWNETHLTVVMVTHDLSEAFGLATRVIALERSRNRPEERERYGATVSRDLEIFPRRSAEPRAIIQPAPIGTTRSGKEHQPGRPGALVLKEQP